MSKEPVQTRHAASARPARVLFFVICLAAALGLPCIHPAAQGPGVQMLADLAPGVPSDSSNPRSFTEIPGGELLFTADDRNGRRDLWKTDGTAAGTSLVVNAFELGPLARVGGVAVFCRDDALWTSDGIVAGTQQIAAVEPVEFPEGWDGTRRRPLRIRRGSWG